MMQTGTETLTPRMVLTLLAAAGISDRHVDAQRSLAHVGAVALTVPRPRSSGGDWDADTARWEHLTARVAEILADAGLTVTERGAPASLLITR